MRFTGRSIGGAVLAAVVLAGCQNAAWLNRSTTVPDVTDVPLSQIGLTPDGWFQSFEQAAVAAQATGRPILMDFTGSDWCGWCIRLDQEVFSSAEFKAWAQNRVVLLKVDLPRQTPQPPALRQHNENLRAKYQIDSYPTVLFVDALGNKIGEAVYEPGGPQVWTQKADQLLKPL